MKPNPIDAAFARFRRSGDADALAAVFDATAPRLLLVAMHLSRDAQAAEDLVQTTFLQAMRDRDGYDPSRPVLPWLLAILHHRALDRHGRAYRMRERGADALQQAGERAASPTPDPAQAAEHRELLEQVAHALDGLPADYRELLALRLVHGLRAVDIAHSKGVPPTTVRTRLRRGLSLLRRALPRGLATPSLLAMLATEWARAQDGLAAVRRTVLAAARPESVAVAAGATLVGAALTKWLLAGVAAIACVVLALRSTTEQPAAPEVATLPQGPAGAQSAAIDATAPARRSGTTDTPNRSRAAPQVTSTGSERTVLHGRVLSAATGGPITGATVTLDSYQPMRHRSTRVDWPPLEPVVTGSDGSYRFTFVPPPELNWNLEVTADRHTPEYVSFESLRSGIEARLEDFLLSPGIPASIHVIAEQGHDAGIQVLLGQSPDGLRPNSFLHVDKTDSNGRADLGTLAAGTWFYRLDTTLDGPREGSFVVALDEPQVERTVRLQLRVPPADRSIRGLVLDAHGAPVTDLELQFHRIGGYGYRTATTNRGGAFSFSVAMVPETEELHRIELPRHRTDVAWLVAPEPVTFGATDLSLRVRRRAPASLTVEVVDGRTGAPVERFGILHAAKRYDHDVATANELLPPVEAHPAGRAVLDDLRPATYLVSVLPEGELAPRAHLEVSIEEAEAGHLRVELFPPAELLVTVRDARSGDALPDVDVSLARMMPADELAEIDVERFEQRLELGRRGGTASHWAVESHDRARSDSQGRVRLHAPPNTPGLAVFAKAPNRRPALLRTVTLPTNGGRAELELQPGGEIRGHLGPQQFVTRYGPRPSALREVRERAHIEIPDPDALRDDYPLIQLRSVEDQGPRFETNVATDGRFAFESLPLGRYEVWCEATLCTPEHATSLCFGPLRTIDVTTETPVELAIDLSDRLPSPVQVRVFVDGQPWTGKVGFEPIEGLSYMKADARDGLAATALLPGRYRAYAVAPVTHHHCDRIFASTTFDVSLGIAAECTLDLRRRRLVVTATDARGAPVTGQRIVPVPLDHPDLVTDYRYGARTDDDGRVVFDPAPPGNVRLVVGVLVPDGERTDVAPGATLAELGAADDACTVRVPAR